MVSNGLEWGKVLVVGGKKLRIILELIFNGPSLGNSGAIFQCGIRALKYKGEVLRFGKLFEVWEIGVEFFFERWGRLSGVSRD